MFVWFSTFLFGEDCGEGGCAIASKDSGRSRISGFLSVRIQALVWDQDGIALPLFNSGDGMLISIAMSVYSQGGTFTN